MYSVTLNVGMLVVLGFVVDIFHVAYFCDIQEFKCKTVRHDAF